MGVFSKIVSTNRQIDTIHTFIGGTKKDITSVWTFVNGQIKQLFPSNEYYTQVFGQNTGGNYSQTLSYGKYKIVISGGGGSGSSVASRNTEYIRNRTQGNGTAGEQITTYLNVPFGQTYTVSGTVGAGAGGSSTDSRSSYHSYSAGTPGSGYNAGTAGTLNRRDHNPVMAGGSGGGSTSLFVNGSLWNNAKGGNGGGATLQYARNISTNPPSDWNNLSVSGGTGGNGGTNSGTGAAGGAATFGAGSSSANTSGAGGNGYVYIYKSSIYPN